MRLAPVPGALLLLFFWSGGGDAQVMAPRSVGAAGASVWQESAALRAHAAHAAHSAHVASAVLRAAGTPWCRSPQARELLAEATVAAVLSADVLGAAVALQPDAVCNSTFAPYSFRALGRAAPPALLLEPARLDGARDVVFTVDLSEAYDYTLANTSWFAPHRDAWPEPVAAWTAPYFDAGAGDADLSTFSVAFNGTGARHGAFGGVATVDVILEELPLELSLVFLNTSSDRVALKANGTVPTFTQSAQGLLSPPVVVVVVDSLGQRQAAVDTVVEAFVFPLDDGEREDILSDALVAGAAARSDGGVANFSTFAIRGHAGKSYSVQFETRPTKDGFQAAHGARAVVSIAPCEPGEREEQDQFGVWVCRRPQAPGTVLEKGIVITVVVFSAVVGVAVSSCAFVLALRRVRRRTATAEREHLRRVLPEHGQDVCLVLTDVEGSTALWEWNPTVMYSAMKVHNKVLRDCARRLCGHEVYTEGDSFMFAFRESTDAVLWCIEAQEALVDAPWPAALVAVPDDVASGAAAVVPASGSGGQVFCGLRVRMACSYGPSDAIPPECEVESGGLGSQDASCRKSRPHTGAVSDEVNAILDTISRGGAVVISGSVWDNISLSTLNAQMPSDSDRTVCCALPSCLQEQGADRSSPNHLDFGSRRAVLGAPILDTIVRSITRATEHASADLHSTRPAGGLFEQLVVPFDLGEHVLAVESLGATALMLLLPSRLRERAPRLEPLLRHTRKTIRVPYTGAPPAVRGTAIVFAHCAGLSALLSADRELVTSQLQLFVKAVQVAACENGGYEVECNVSKGSLLLAFRDSKSAIRACLEANRALVDDVEWADDLANMPQAETLYTVGCQPLFRGLRLRAGVAVGNLEGADVHGSSGRMAYWGPVLNECARVASICAGGQVLCNSTAWQQACSDVSSAIGTVLGSVKLKGMGSPVEVVDVRSERFKQRAFPPLRGVVNPLEADGARA